MPRLLLTILACLALALGGAFVSACGGDETNDSGVTAPATPPAAETETENPESTGGTSPTDAAKVSMKASKFDPEQISVKVGQKITWTNNDGYAHNVTSTSGEKINSGNIDGDGTFDYTPKKAGTIAYTCTLHADQNGSITVTK